MMTTQRSGLQAALALAAANLAASADKAVVSVYAPELRRVFHLNDAQIGALQGAPFVIGYVLALLWAGRRTADPTTSRYIAVCIAIWTAGAAAFALAPGFNGLVAGRVILAIGQAAFTPAAVVMLNSLARDDANAGAARFLSLFTASSTIGRSTGLILGGVLLSATAVFASQLPDVAAWRLSGLAMLAPNLLLLGLFLSAEKAQASPTPSLGLMKAVRHIAGRAPAMLIWTVAACGMIVMVQACAAWSPSILHRQFGLTVANSGITIGLVTLIAAPIGHLGAGWMLSRYAAMFNRSAMVLAIAAIVATGCAVAVWGSTSVAVTVTALAGLMAFSGFGAALVLIRIQPLFPQPLMRSANSLFFVATTIVGSAAGPAITGWVSDVVAADGGQLPLSLAVVVSMAGAVVALASLMLAMTRSVVLERPAGAGVR